MFKYYCSQRSCYSKKDLCSTLIFYKISTCIMLMFMWVSIPSYAERPVNLDLSKMKIRRYVDSGEYMNEIREVCQDIQRYLERRIAKKQRDEKVSIVLDIDETALSNYKILNKLDFGSRGYYDQTRIVLPPEAIVPVRDLYNYAISNAIDVFFITGRGINKKKITEQELYAAGYDKEHQVYYRVRTRKHRCGNYCKSLVRKILENKGYTILANIGDQETDLYGGHAEKSFKIPNPFYSKKYS